VFSQLLGFSRSVDNSVCLVKNNGHKKTDPAKMGQSIQSKLRMFLFQNRFGKTMAFKKFAGVNIEVAVSDIDKISSFRPLSGDPWLNAKLFTPFYIPFHALFVFQAHSTFNSWPI
jgi:hypothetical protein